MLSNKNPVKPVKKGIYNLLIYLNKGRSIKTGKLGTFFFKRGYYIYTGSAQNSLYKRVERHISSQKKLHWHIDYLLEHAKISKAYIFESLEYIECKLSKEVAMLPESQLIINGFGSSDCSCKTHLYFFPKRPALNSSNGIIKQMKVFRDT